MIRWGATALGSIRAARSVEELEIESTSEGTDFTRTHDSFHSRQGTFGNPHSLSGRQERIGQQLSRARIAVRKESISVSSTGQK